MRLHLHLPQRCSPRQIQMESGPYNRPRGSLIVLEGLDRCGKTSQSSKLVSHLEEKGFSVESWRFPDRTTSVGEMISAYLSNKSHLDDRAIHLLFSANRWEKRFVLLFLLRIMDLDFSNLFMTCNVWAIFLVYDDYSSKLFFPVNVCV